MIPARDLVEFARISNVEFFRESSEELERSLLRHFLYHERPRLFPFFSSASTRAWSPWHTPHRTQHMRL